MDIRTMQYYLAVVREGTISAAAQALHSLRKNSA